MSEWTVKEFAHKERVDERTVRRWAKLGRVSIEDGVVVPTAKQSLRYSWFSGVYFVRCEDFVKIGYAYDVRSRLEQIKTHVPYEVSPLWFRQCGSQNEAKALEASLHQRFANIRRRGEWFMYGGRIEAYVAEHAGLWPSPRRH